MNEKSAISSVTLWVYIVTIISQHEMGYFIDLESESGTSKDTLWLGTRIKSTFVFGWMSYQIGVELTFGYQTKKA